MTPNGVWWEALEPGTYEDVVSVLISRLHPEAQRIDGSGGDGGRDVQVPTGDGLVIFEFKSFTGRMHASRRRQVEASLERAAQHELAAWRLVVPVDPTPGELEWFEGLSAGYGFECRWLGKCWLDGEMVDKPEIARYYAHGQRHELQEFLDLLRGVGAEPPSRVEGAAHHKGALRGREPGRGDVHPQRRLQGHTHRLGRQRNRVFDTRRRQRQGLLHAASADPSQEERRKKRPQISTHWTIPDNPLVPASLVGATVRVRHTRTNSERIAGRSRSRALRIFPESDHRFDGLFGLREDSESANSDYKSRLWNKRCRTMRHESVEFNNIGYQIHVLITALVAYHNRTGADMTEWFGLHELPTKRKRRLALAA